VAKNIQWYALSIVSITQMPVVEVGYVVICLFGWLKWEKSC
jgi:hypothetical protein